MEYDIRQTDRQSHIRALCQMIPSVCHSAHLLIKIAEQVIISLAIKGRRVAFILVVLSLPKQHLPEARTNLHFIITKPFN